MARTTTYEDAAPFIAQPSSLDWDMGRNIDWANNVAASEIPAGTVMVELTGGLICPWSERPGVETAIGILAVSANENDRSGYAGHGLIIGGVIFENVLVDFDGGNWATMKGELSSNFHWLTFEDDR